MIRAISIRRGRAGTWDTLKLIYEMGIEGATLPDVRQFVQAFPISQWDSLMRTFWHYEEEETETLRSVRLQAEHLQQQGVMIGDCDDAAVVAVALGRAMPAVPFGGAVRPPEAAEFQHVFV